MNRPSLEGARYYTAGSVGARLRLEVFCLEQRPGEAAVTLEPSPEMYMTGQSRLAAPLRVLGTRVSDESPAARSPSHTQDGRTPAEQALEVERQRKEIFVSTLAHELRQPLWTLLAAVEVLRLTTDSAAASRATEIMKRQIGQMNRVVEDLLDATRWGRGKVTLRKQRLDVRDVISDAALDMAAAVAERGHELVVVTASEPLWADADPQRLHQVLSNLLRNAVKYTDPGGHLSLAADRGPDTIILRVRDTGRGLEPASLPRIFDLFSQVRPPEAAGVGIGLSVVREIVALHGGRIEARSDGPGRGSEFIVTLPLAPPPAAQDGAAT